VVARYGPGGTYWANLYHQQFGAAAKPLPVQFWQIWNEPNLRKYFAPTGGGAQKYAQLLQISHNVIKGRNPNARIVLAGMLGSGDQTAWYFLRSLYGVAGFRANFDVAALHPYASTLGQFRDEIVRVRGVMANRGDAAKPLWLSEFGWGSAPPDRYGINKGLYGQRKMLVDSFNRVLDNRRAWNVQRIYWFIWRDPKPGSPQATLCSFCGSGGLLTYGRAAKPAYSAFRSFTAETNPPTAAITGGPAQGGFTRDSTPTFTFSSSEHGSTFACRFGAQPFSPCSSPFTSRLPDGARTFAVHAIDAPGNQSAAVSRSFTVDTRPPAAPQITDTDPDSPANINTLRVKGSAEPASRVRLYKTAGCAGAPLAQGWAGQFAAPGIAVTVADNTATAFRATATDRAGNTSACSAPLYYVERSTP
jgi:hypothetical protein